jgi:hypothetical protein
MFCLQVPDTIFDCDHPIFKEPPSNLASSTYRVVRGKVTEHFVTLINTPIDNYYALYHKRFLRQLCF